MKFLDTNVLVRFLTQDVPEAAEQAKQWIVQARRHELMVEEAVLEELTFVLAFHANYRIPREVIANALDRLSAIPSIAMSKEAQAAIKYYRQYPKLDFVDCLLLVKAAHYQGSVLTFDKDLSRAAKQATLTGLV